MNDDCIHILSTGEIKDLSTLDIDSTKIILDVIPFIQTKFIQDQRLNSTINRLATESAFVAFTSPKAVQAVHQLLQGKQPAWKIYCIGYATKNEVLKFFYKSELINCAANANELAEAIIQDIIKDVVFFCGDLRRDELPKQLVENGIAVEEVIVYETLLKPVHVKNHYSGILFFSPSAVNSFFSMNDGGDAAFFVIGNTTAAALKNFGIKSILISEQPSKLDLAKKAISYFQEKINR